MYISNININDININDMNRKTFLEFMAFARCMSLMNEPFEKVWDMFTDANHLNDKPNKKNK